MCLAVVPPPCEGSTIHSQMVTKDKISPLVELENLQSSSALPKTIVAVRLRGGGRLRISYSVRHQGTAHIRLLHCNFFCGGS